MARILTASGVTLPGRAFGVSFSEQLGNPIARARAIPLNPKTNATSVAANALAYVAALWRTLGPAVWTNWYTPPQTLGDGYNLFLQWNIRAYTWGCSYFEAPLVAPIIRENPILSVVSMDDHKTTLLLCGTGRASTPPGGLYMRVYVAWTTVPGGHQPTAASYAYAFSIGPLGVDQRYSYDLTPLVNANLGQWIYPGDITTVPVTPPALSLNCGYYCTDNTGLVFLTAGGPYYDIYFGPSPQANFDPPFTPILPFTHVAPWLRWNQTA